jgi:2-C-methyl-D-erythritol 4-phosphate cytidylyltransferase
MKKFAIIVAAGSGIRMGTSLPKQFLTVQGKPLIWYSIKAFQDAFEDISIILVLPAANLEEGKTIIQSSKYPHSIQIISGGSSRFQSVSNGLKYVEHPSIVFVHDGVRCMVSSELIIRCYNAALEKGSAIPSISSADSIRMETNGEYRVIDRQKIKIIQTPQTFQSNWITEAFSQKEENSFTDEATVVEQSGKKIHLVEGEASNIKITLPIDLLLAEKILSSL